MTAPLKHRKLRSALEWYKRLYPHSPNYRYQDEVLCAYEQAVDEATSGAPDPLEIVVNPQARQSGKNTTSARWAVRKGLKYGHLAKKGRGETWQLTDAGKTAAGSARAAETTDRDRARYGDPLQ